MNYVPDNSGPFKATRPYRWRSRKLGNPRVRRIAAVRIANWVCAMVEWPRERVLAVRNDPKAKVGKVLAAMVVLGLAGREALMWPAPSRALFSVRWAWMTPA